MLTESQRKENRAATQRKYAATHRSKKVAYDREWKQKNKEKLAAQSNARYHANPAKQRDSNRRWRRKNPGKHELGLKNWRTAHPEINLANARARYAAERQAVPLWAGRKRMLAWYAARLAAQELFGVAVQVDHIVPLRSNKVCGLHCEDNMQLLPAVVNAAKSNRVWSDMW
jgi:hypothetical protein